MGLDMMPLARPHIGLESEFESLWLTYQNLVNGITEPVSTTRQGFLGRLLGRSRSKKNELERLTKAIMSISEGADQNMGAPVVGVDAAANLWIEQSFKNGAFLGLQSCEAALEQMDGFHVLELLPECDGFPVYSNSFLHGSGVPRTSFRGDFLRDCVDVLTAAQISDAWVPKLSRDLLAYGESLCDSARNAAVEEGATDVIDRRAPPDVVALSRVYQIHIADSCGRWCKFWAKRGHGLEPDF
ncbi:hypothetical protein [Paracoccus laeviglucosivorans]|uniref:Uncharacterized protein n=1 Tax=Paracoccus laeviglucosivorans TaxID=1197861 RepID=A0A521DXE1_9RHOB|nr:hypothetical protein [Paracoccus laeviglucosivorans]SMO76315.1 hypothetical protein SAMN06265221_11074 [Paracoccus laeviglucosivorans]